MFNPKLSKSKKILFQVEVVKLARVARVNLNGGQKINL